MLQNIFIRQILLPNNTTFLIKECTKAIFQIKLFLDPFH